MKTLFFLTILFCVITLPVNAQLKDADLNKIRLIVKEEIKPLDTRLQKVEQSVARLEGRIDGIDKLITWLIAIVILVFGAPQVIALWRSNKTDKEQERINQELRAEIETLKQQRIVNP